MVFHIIYNRLIEKLGTLDWVVAGAVLIVIVGLCDVVAGCYLCCHPDRKEIAERRDLLGLNDSLEGGETEQDIEKALAKQGKVDLKGKVSEPKKEVKKESGKK